MCTSTSSPEAFIPRAKGVGAIWIVVLNSYLCGCCQQHTVLSLSSEYRRDWLPARVWLLEPGRMNSAGEPLCDKCSVNGSVDCSQSELFSLRTQIILRIYPINRPPAAQTPHSLLWLMCLCAQSLCFLALRLNTGPLARLNHSMG